jgi:hypothetical protein
MNLSGVLRATLLEIDEDVTHRKIREMTALQISLSGAYLMTCLRSGMIDLISKSSELITALNLERLLKMILRLLEKESRHVIERVCKASIRSSTRFLRSM